MIGKVVIGKSFRGCITYCLEDKKFSTGEALTNHRAEVLQYNLCFGNKKELAEQFRDVRKLNPRLSKPVLHITLSLANGEKVNRDLLQQIAEDCAKHMGFEGNQYLAIEHKDTAHQHLHIIANRVGFDGRTLCDSNSYKKIADFCRQSELKYGLQQVLSPKRFLSNEQRQLPRNDSRKQRLRSHLIEALFRAKNYTQFESIMKAREYRIERGRGIAFIDNKGVRIKGSEVGYPLRKIEKILGQQLQKRAIFESGLGNKKSIEKSLELNAPLKQFQSITKDMAENLLQPKQQMNNAPSQLLQKKKKKKRAKLHL